MPTSNDAAQSWENARLDALSRGGHMLVLIPQMNGTLFMELIMSNWCSNL